MKKKTATSILKSERLLKILTYLLRKQVEKELIEEARANEVPELNIGD